MSRARWLLATLALGAATWAFASSSPPAVGLWQDDAVYLATARSLADGTSYRHVELPGEPLQTKYPVLYPALLALVFRLGPDYPAALPWLLAPGAFLGAGFLALSALYLRRVLQVPRARVLLVCALSALSPELLSLARFAMSDLPYACLAATALCCLDRPAAQAGDRRAAALLVAAGLLVAAAVLTRSIGLSLAVAAPLPLLARRRFGRAALLVAVVAAACAPWWLWQAAAAAANGPLQSAPGTAYDLSYGLWLPDGAGQLARVAVQNLFRAIFGIAFFQLALPAEPSLAALASGGWPAAALHAVCYAAAALLALGFANSLRRGLRTLHVYALLYGAALLVWPFEPYRFLICWTPFLIHFELEGLACLGRWIDARAPRPSPRRAEAPALLAAALLLTAFAVEDARLLASTPEHYYLLRRYRERTGHAEVVNWLRAHGRPGEVVVSDDTADLFLATGLPVRDTTPGLEPLAAYYGPDRRWRQLYVFPSASEAAAAERLVAPHLEALFRGEGVRWYVQRPGGRLTAAAHSFAQRHPGWFRPVFEAPGGSQRVFRVR